VPLNAVADIVEVEMKVGPVRLRMYGLCWCEVLSAANLVEPPFEFVDLFRLESPQAPKSQIMAQTTETASVASSQVVEGIGGRECIRTPGTLSSQAVLQTAVRKINS
jgi:hypothetical protein